MQLAVLHPEWLSDSLSHCPSGPGPREGNSPMARWLRVKDEVLPRADRGRRVRLAEEIPEVGSAYVRISFGIFLWDMGLAGEEIYAEMELVLRSLADVLKGKLD